MGMRIANNISAMTTQRWLGVADAGMTKSLERLSSGYRINRAADDSAGLAISSGFRADIASFRVASRNTSEANSLLQVAEGGMEQIENMLIRLKELATQASSGNVGGDERTKINAEGNHLISEIDRIANSTKYGSTNLLDGTYGGRSTTIGAPTNNTIANTYNYYDIAGGGSAALSAAALTFGTGSPVCLTGEATWYMGMITGAGAASTSRLALWHGVNLLSGADMYEVFSASVAFTAGSTTVTFGSLGVTMTVSGSLTGATAIKTGYTAGVASTTLLTLHRTGLSSINAGSATAATYTFSDASGSSIKLVGNGTSQELTYSASVSSYNFNVQNISVNLGSDYTDQDINGMTITVTGSASDNTFQIGNENNANNQISFTLDNVKATASAGFNLSVDQLSTSANAQTMLTSVDTAISSLASSRGTIGAYMNRLSYANANLTSTIENVQAAESIIRDVDMATEMTQFTKNQILLQAGTAMLAQANMAPQQVLALFG